MYWHPILILVRAFVKTISCQIRLLWQIRYFPFFFFLQKTITLKNLFRRNYGKSLLKKWYFSFKSFSKVYCYTVSQFLYNISVCKIKMKIYITFLKGHHNTQKQIFSCNRHSGEVLKEGTLTCFIYLFSIFISILFPHLRQTTPP